RTVTITWPFAYTTLFRSSQTQNVTVDDVTAPVANVATLPTITGECSATVSTAPTANDNCVGTVTATGKIGATPITLPYTKTTQDTVTTHGCYEDANGNTS